MVTVPSLEDETPLDQYTATASQTDFNFTYMIFATEDIKVYVNNVLKTETTDYVVKQSDDSAIVPADDLPMDGGKIVFNSGLSSGDKVSLSRDIGIKRLTGYKVAGPFRADVVNAELTKLYAIQQQLERDISRSVRLNASDAEGGTLEIPSDRAGKFLAFNANREMIASAGSADGLVVSSYIGTLLDDTTASEALDTLGVAAYAKTLLDDTTASEALDTLGVAAFAKTLLDDTDAATARATLDAEQKINSLTAITALEDADQLAVSDNSDSNNSKKITYANLKSDLSSKIVDINHYQTSAVATLSGIIPMDNTRPLSSEGSQCMSITHTPQDAANKLLVHVLFRGGETSNVSNDFVVALFKDSDTDALSAGFGEQVNPANQDEVNVKYGMTANTTSTITFKVRAGNRTSGSLYMNGTIHSGGQVFGGACYSSITIIEYKA